MKLKYIINGIVFISILLLFSFSLFDNKEEQNLELWYKSPAKQWIETLPLGNGRIGMMPDGGVNKELIVLNDITMWSGSKDTLDNVPLNSSEYLTRIRSYLLEAKNIEAQKLMAKFIKTKGLGPNYGRGNNAPFGSFQLLGNLDIKYLYSDNNSEFEQYKRSLSLNNAVARTSFVKSKINYKREYFSSMEDDIMCVHLSSDKSHAISLELHLSRPERANVSVESNALIMQGQLNDGYDGNKGIKYYTRLELKNKGGNIECTDTSIKVIAANVLDIYISSSTDMLDSNYRQTVDNRIINAKKYSYKRLKDRHIKAYQKKFNRVSLNLGPQNNTIPTDKRLLAFSEKDDPSFAALYFQYGRYLMISGTNERTIPLNLQGMWANSVQVPWNGDYHVNINLQMNYWPSEVCNLSSLNLPLIEFIKSLEASGKKTAQNFYNAKGWLAHIQTNPWQYTAPGLDVSWGATTTGGAWLCSHLWEHYLFTQDKEYLKSIYPTLVGAAEFFLSTMIEEPKHHYLVTSPSASPENSFYQNGSTTPIYICMGPSIDIQIIRDLFSNILSAANILGIEDNTTTEIKRALSKLPPIQIGAKGNIQEWLEDYEEVDPHHRHVSQLYALYPSNQISVNSTPQLAKAAKVTLNRRGDEGTGWSRAWKINFWARLHEGNRAYKLLRSLLQPTYDTNNTILKGGGTYPNLLCAHPPFQIDGNFGGTAGIAEMLVQSQDGYIELLPAIPDSWKKGDFRGLCVRGGAELSISWNNGIIDSVELKALCDNTFKIKLANNIKAFVCKGQELYAEKGIVSIKLDKGKSIKLTTVLD